MTESETIQEVDFTGPDSVENLVTFNYGIKTLTHNRRGLKLHPVQGIEFALCTGTTKLDFHVQPDEARRIASKLIEYSDKIEKVKVK